MVLHTCHAFSFTVMKKDRVFIGGRVDVKLKNLFLVELRNLNRLDGADSPRPLTQSKFFEMLLVESVMARQSNSAGKDGTSLQK